MTAETAEISRETGRELNIAMVAESMDTGLALLIPTLIRGLHERGHSIHLIHSVKRTDPAALAALSGLERLSLEPISMSRAVDVGDLNAVLRIRALLHRCGPLDVVHGHSSKGGALARLAALGGGAARIYSPHAFYTASPGLTRRARQGYATAERILSLITDGVICSSEQERGHALELGIAPDKLILAPSAIPEPQIAPRAQAQFGFPPDAVVIGFIGRLAYQKGPDIFIRALAEAAAADPRVHGVVVGDGALEGEMQALARDLGLADRIAFLGRRPSTSLLASFDALAMASRYEGYSLMPLEAAYAGTPLVCTAVGGVDEAVEDGRTGLVVPVDDPSAMAAAFLTLTATPALRARLADNAKLKVKGFSVPQMVEAYEGAYRLAMARRHRRSASPNSPRGLH